MKEGKKKKIVFVVGWGGGGGGGWGGDQQLSQKNKHRLGDCHIECLKTCIEY